MGFPEGRTARAVKRLGHDDRLVSILMVLLLTLIIYVLKKMPESLLNTKREKIEMAVWR